MISNATKFTRRNIINFKAQIFNWLGGSNILPTAGYLEVIMLFYFAFSAKKK